MTEHFLFDQKKKQPGISGFAFGVAGGLERSPVCVRCHAVSGAVGALVLPALASGSLRGLVPL